MTEIYGAAQSCMDESVRVSLQRRDTREDDSLQSKNIVLKSWICPFARNPLRGEPIVGSTASGSDLNGFSPANCQIETCKHITPAVSGTLPVGQRSQVFQFSLDEP